MKDIVNKDQEIESVWLARHMNCLLAKDIRKDIVEDPHPILKQIMGATYIGDFAVRCKIPNNIQDDDIISIKIMCRPPTSKCVEFTVGRIREILNENP